MKKMFYSLILTAVVICCLSMNSFAQTGWVSDMLLLTFRQGPGKNHAVIKTLKSNTQVTIQGEENGFYNVKLLTGEQGWVDKIFITFDQPKNIIISQLKQKNEELVKKIASLESELDVKNSITTSASESKEADNTLIDQSENLKNIVEENKALKQENEVLYESLEQSRDKNKNQFKVAMIKWFLAGVGVLLIGWIIGQSVSTRGRSSGSLLD